MSKKNVKNEAAAAAAEQPQDAGTAGAATGEGTAGMAGLDTKESLKAFVHYLGSSYLVPIIIAAVFAAAGSILDLMGPSRLSKVTDLITEGLSSTIDIDAIVKICVTLLIIYAIGFVLNLLQGVIMAQVSMRSTRQMRADVVAKIDRLPLSYLDKTPVGDILSLISNDIDTIAQTLNTSLATLISSIALLIGSAVMMLVTNWVMGLAGIVVALVGFAIMMKIIGRSQGYFMQQQQVLGALTGHVEEVYGGLAQVKTNNADKPMRKTFDNLNGQMYDAAWKAQFMSGLMQPIMIFVGNLAYVVVCIIGGVMVHQGTISFGVVVAFMIYIRQFAQPLQNLAQVASTFQTLVAACSRVFTFLGEEELAPEKNTEALPEQVKGKVAFEHVRFGYDAVKPIIHDFSVNVEPGEKVAIVGPTGAGKTTLVNLLMRFYEIDDGRISLDDVDTSHVGRTELRNEFGMVLQDTWVFEGTLRENLVFNHEATDEELYQALQAVGLGGWVKKLPQGLDTVLNEATALSAGQRQLITIARAMVDDSPLLILDEATSSVDTRTELKVQEAMDTLTKGRTSFVIAHRLSTIKNSDLILVMNHGDIIEQGTHEELLEAGGFYANLYNAQFTTGGDIDSAAEVAGAGAVSAA